MIYGNLDGTTTFWKNSYNKGTGNRVLTEQPANIPIGRFDTGNLNCDAAPAIGDISGEWLYMHAYIVKTAIAVIAQVTGYLMFWSLIQVAYVSPASALVDLSMLCSMPIILIRWNQILQEFRDGQLADF